jgi:nucleotide-binding universal stress UspA family protein
MRKQTGRGLLAALLVAILTTGCHKPTFDHLEPRQIKWSLLVLAEEGDDAQNRALQAAVEKTARDQGVTAQVRFVKPEEADAALEQSAQIQGLDLIVLGTRADNLASVASQHPELRFAVAGELADPGVNVRQVVLDRKRLLFLAGFLAAEANKQSSEPITVLVDRERPANDPDWQMILAGVRYAGRKDTPVQIKASLFAEREASVQPNATERNVGENSQRRMNTRPAQPPKLSGRGLIFLDGTERTAPEQAFAAMRAKGMLLIRTDQDPRPIALQDRVAAVPTDVLETALKEEAATLASGKWAGEQSVAVKQIHHYDLRLPELFADRALSTRLEQVEELLAAGSIQPESYLDADRD